MGLLHFLVPRRDRVGANAAQRAYFAGMDAVPWTSRIRWNDEGLVLERDTFESGNFYVPYVVAGRGELMLSTASLMERPRPYHLHVELARGTLNRLRNQIAYAPPPAGSALARHLEAARDALSRAVTHRTNIDEAARLAEVSIAESLAAIDLLAAAQAEQWIAARRTGGVRLSTLLGVNLGDWKPAGPVANLLSSAFNTVQIPLTWRDLEACEGHRDFSAADAQIDAARLNGFKICGGPLLTLDKQSLPDWTYLFGEDDIDTFRACVAEHIQAVVSHFRGRVHLWVCSSGLNIESKFIPSEEERLRLAVLTIDSIRRQDPRSPIVLSIDQPWGAFMNRHECDLSPLHFADALVRAELGLAGLGLELNVGYMPDASEPRDALEFGHEMDRYASLGLPLLLSLTAPSADTVDAKATRRCEVTRYASQAVSPESQRQWAEQILPTLLARQPVQGILWNQLFDSRPHAFPHGGVIDDHDRPKPLLNYLEQLRRTHLA